MTEKKVSIWFGKFSSREAFEEYIELEYDDEGDATSQFLKDFDIEFIDEDFQEVSSEENMTIDEAIIGFSYAESFIDQIPKESSGFNSFLLVYEDAYEGDIKESDCMTFMGVFDFVED
jgi:hypothetical protein